MGTRQCPVQSQRFVQLHLSVIDPTCGHSCFGAWLVLLVRLCFRKRVIWLTRPSRGFERPVGDCDSAGRRLVDLLLGNCFGGRMVDDLLPLPLHLGCSDTDDAEVGQLPLLEWTRFSSRLIVQLLLISLIQLVGLFLPSAQKLAVFVVDFGLSQSLGRVAILTFVASHSLAKDSD